MRNYLGMPRNFYLHQGAKTQHSQQFPPYHCQNGRIQSPIIDFSHICYGTIFPFLAHYCEEDHVVGLSKYDCTKIVWSYEYSQSSPQVYYGLLWINTFPSTSDQEYSVYKYSRSSSSTEKNC